MKRRKAGANARKNGVKFSIAIVIAVMIVGIVLAVSMYFMIQKSFFKATISHEMELMELIESQGSQLIDYRIGNLKEKTEITASQYGSKLRSGSDEEKRAALSSISATEYTLNYCYRTDDAFYSGKQFGEKYAKQLDLSEVWKGKTVLFDPDFDQEDNYVFAVAAPVWESKAEHKVAGVLIQQIDGYCISHWLSDIYTDLDFGTAYIVNREGRHIATAREENYDWITTRYNAQELAKENDDESTQSVAKLEKRALDGETATGTYIWEGSTNYVSFGPIEETGWGFFVGFYGKLYQQYTKSITSISSRAAGAALIIFILFLSAIVAVIMRTLHKEREYSETLMRQKTEIEQQAVRIEASEERFRVAMQRSRDIILEYHLETGDITCFYQDREINSGRIGDDALRRRLLEDCYMDEDSFCRFDEAIRAISKGVTSVECILSGNNGAGQKWYRMSISAIPGGGGMPTRAVGILQDVTGEREAELDLLTRLLNKSAMIDNIKKALRKNMPQTVGAFVMLDVDHFKNVNDQYGHPAGDQVLRAIADQLREVFPSPYLTSRFGGDEFSVYCQSNVESQELRRRLQQLSESIRQIQIKGCGALHITVSIGVVVFRGKTEFERIYKKADEMLYQVKEAGRDAYRIFEDK